jgi:hypothetical protein
MSFQIYLNICKIMPDLKWSEQAELQKDIPATYLSLSLYPNRRRLRRKRIPPDL